MQTYRHPLKLAALAAALSLTSLLAACGGGGGGSTTSSGSTSTAATGIPAGTTQATPTYAAGSAQLAMFQAINAYRQQCGFPALAQNTLLDQAAQNHTSYMAQNGGVVTDDEVAGQPGFTGVTGQDRANALGWPSNEFAGAGDAGDSGPTMISAQAGQFFINAWASGIYHSSIITFPANLTGFGYAESATTINGTTYPLYLGGIELGQVNSNVAGSGAPLTFPCQGVSGLPYAGTGEIPSPPNTNGPWGAPVVVTGNLTDTVVLQSGTMTAPNGTVITLNLLNSSNDPNKLIGAYEAVAYPTSPLSANTPYGVTLTGTINGTAFSRNFTFTTGNIVG